MLRKRASVALSLALLVAVPVTFLTGSIAAALDLNRFVFHRYAAYLVVVLVTAHVIVQWQILGAQVRRRLPSEPTPRAGEEVTPTKAKPGAIALSRRVFLWSGLSLAAGAVLGHWLSSQTRPPTLKEGEDLGQVYHQWSKPTYGGLLAKSLRPRPQPSPYKEYGEAPVVELPPPGTEDGPPLEVAIGRRRSVREYGGRPITLGELSRLLHYSDGITDRRDPTLPFRAAPSAGALYPIELYPVLFNVSGASPGAYHYDVLRHRLQLLRAGELRADVFRGAMFQETVLQAALVVVLTAVFPRLQWKYADRSYRYIMLEAGHIGQNFCLEATGLGLGACSIGAFFDDDLNNLLDLDGRDEATVYLLAVGPQKP